MTTNKQSSINQQLIEEEARRQAAQHGSSGSNLEAMMARISAEVTNQAAAKKVTDAVSKK